MTIAFAGHSFISSSDIVKKAVKEEIIKNIINSESVTFYLGGYGDFDKICACVCKELKKENSKILVAYVAPYISLSEQAKIKEMLDCGLCDTCIYPPIEKVPPKYAILKRNEWMMTNSDLVIACVNCKYGGAYKSLQMAKRKKKKIINVGALENEI